MKFLGIYFGAVIITAFFIFTTKTKKTKSLNNFICRGTKELAYIGMAASVGIPLLMILVALFYQNVEHLEHIPVADPMARLDALGTDWKPIFILSFILGFPLMLACIRGFWDVIVEKDDITVKKLFLFKSHWKFSQIDYVKMTRGGLKCYVKGRKRMAFFVDAFTCNFSNFRKRLEKELKEEDMRL